MFKGRTVDGAPRLLSASLGDGKAKQSFWWFTPLDQPEGWFDDQGTPLGGTALAEPRPDARISSPFGTRRYYGRSDRRRLPQRHRLRRQDRRADLCRGRRRDQPPGRYYNYGRTVKISHADNFETLYAHMSRFATASARLQVHKAT